MNHTALLLASLVWVLSTASASAARATSDLQPSQTRQTAVTAAESLWQRKLPPPPPESLQSPFNPSEFNKPDPSELAAPSPQSSEVAGAPSTAPRSAAFLGDREVLERLAAQISPSGVIQLRGSPRLIISGKSFEIGTRFTVTLENRDYELELSAIDRTTFTLRYRNEELTRPIKPAR